MEAEYTNLINLIKHLNINEERTINILLLGSSGVGKSTFLNSLANYLTFPTLEDAKKEKPVILVSCLFSIMDRNYETHSVKVKSDCSSSESLEVGESGTQEVKAYLFPFGVGKTKLRVIDCPGIGDTRGMEQDKVNCENIMSYLSRLEELHAICCLFSTSNSRSTVYFDYCFKEILSRLDKTASKNLIFMFTNSRAACFSPGESYPTLKKTIADIEKQPPHVKIPFDLKKNIFCVENDCFKYLVAKSQGIEFNEYNEKTYKESWIESATQCWRMIGYIVGDRSNTPLAPHDIRNTVSVNEARRMVVSLSKPLSDVTQMIQDNIIALNRHSDDLNSGNNSIEQLREKLYIPLVDIKVVELDQPITACNSNRCTSIYVVNGIQKRHIKQRCCDPCNFQYLPKFIADAFELRWCGAMDSDGNCTVCGCHYKEHIRTYYLTETIDIKIVDNVVKGTLKTKEEALLSLKTVVNDIENRKKAYEDERNQIIGCTAQFVQFLKKNAIAPYNDSYEKNIEHMIERERLLGDTANQETIEQLERLKLQYTEMKQFYEQQPNGVACEDVFKSVQTLYNLKYTGAKIRELLNSAQASKSRETNSITDQILPSAGIVLKFVKKLFK